MPKQRFEDLPGLGGQTYRNAANICLFLGNDEDDNLHLTSDEPGKARMAWLDWGRGYARIMARLSESQPGRPKPLVLRGRTIEECRLTPRPFVLCPNLKKSFLSVDMAHHFNLTTTPGVLQGCRIPLTLSLTGQMRQVTSGLLARAYMTIECDGAVDPPPFPKTARAPFLILDEPWTPRGLGILGRDIINHMLLLYCGSDPAGERAQATAGGSTLAK